jgi:hypothetical protein
MAQDPDNETLIFRKFDSLAARNLLYLQAELFELKRKISKVENKYLERQNIDMMLSARIRRPFFSRREAVKLIRKQKP